MRGSYAPALSRRCTHLLAAGGGPASRKLALAARNVAAGRWGTRIVRPAWLADSAAARARLPEAAYARAPAAEGSPRGAPAGALLWSFQVTRAHVRLLCSPWRGLS